MDPQSSPAVPRTFHGDPHPPPAELEAPKISSAPAVSSSAGTGALPPAAATQDATSTSAPRDTQKAFSVVERPDGSRDAFVSDDKGDSKLWTVHNPDADEILKAVGRYDPATKTWSNIPEGVIKSLGEGRLAFPERITNAWEGGEVGVVRSLLGARVMTGELPGASAKEQGDPLLLKVRLDQEPSIAWQGGFGKTVAAMLKHPLNTAESAAVGAVGMVPLMKDILLHGAAPGAAMGAVAGGAAAGVGLAAGPLAPEAMIGIVANGMKIGIQYGTFKRAMDVMGGQFAMDMVDKGYDDKTIQKYAPIVGALNGALTLMRFDLLTPAMKSAALTNVLGSSAVKEALNSWVGQYAQHVAGFAALGTAQEGVSILAGNMAAVAAQKPELLTSGPESKKRLLDAALQMTLAGAVMGIPGVAIEARGVEAKAGAAVGALGENESPLPSKEAALRSAREPGVTEEKQGSALPTPEQTVGSETPYDKSIARNPDAVKGGFGSLENIGKSEQIHPDLLKEAESIINKEGPADFNAHIKDKGVLKYTMDSIAEESKAQFEALKKVDPAQLTPEQAGFLADSADRAIKRYRLGTDAELPAGVDELADRLRERADYGDLKGRWFSTLGPKESPYSNIPGRDTRYVDVPMTDLEKYSPPDFAGKRAAHERVLSADLAAKAQLVFPGEPLPALKEGYTRLFRAADTKEPSANRYVLNRPFELVREKNDKRTAAEIRKQFEGIKNEQIVRGNQLADEIRRAVPDAEERAGMFWYKAAEGNRSVLEDALADPDLEKYHDQIQKALNLSDKAKAAVAKVDRYYTEAGDVSQEIGTINNVRENYQNRIYAPEKSQDFVKNETNSGIKQTTRHAKQRVYQTEFEAARDGKTFATTDVADALSVHNEEMARVNAARKMADSMAQAGLGAWKREAPAGWEQVGTLQKAVPIKDKAGAPVIGEDGNQVVSRSLFVAPEGIAKGLSAITDPNFTKKIDSLRGIQRYQGVVKTVDLAFSLFHHFSLVAQSVYQRDLSVLLNLPKMSKFLESPDFQGLEQDFALHGGMTSMVEANQDILRNLTRDNGDVFSQISNAPGVKQVLETADKNAQFLFGKMQRFQKVYSYSGRVADWIADHPNATNEEVKAVKQDLARHVNAVFGGLNWGAMGMTKSNLSLLRIGLLAPDWTVSNISLLKQAIGERGAAGQASRAHILSSLAIGMLATEGLNKFLTGHGTEENKPGHRLEVEIAPDVYVSLLRGGIGDITKFASMVAESGLGGVARFGQGKLAPFARTGVGLLTNTQYTGAPIAHRNTGPVAGTYEVLKYALANVAPVPLGVSNLLSYAKSDEPNAAGGAAVASGTGRFSRK